MTETKKLISLILLCLTASLAGAQVTNYLEPEFGWVSPSVMGQGGSFASARGFDILFYNPAGYADEPGKFHIVIRAEAITDPFILMEDIHAGEPVADLLINQLVANGMGANAQLGFGWVGRGFGAALVINGGTHFGQTDNTLSAKGYAYTDVGLTGGYSHLFPVGNDLTISVGGTGRIFYRMRAPIDFDSFSSLFTGGELDYSTMSLLGGIGLGADLGAGIRWKSLYGQLSLKNVGHGWMIYKEGSVEDFFKLEMPTEGAGDNRYIIPMSLAAGVEFHPDLGRSAQLIDPRVSLSYEVPLLIGIDPLAFQGYTNKTFWTGIHLGGELKLLNVFLFRAGLNQGYLTAGMGFDFIIGELAFSLYSRETGRISGDSREMAAAVQLSFRF
jgi:hypothetical protein